MIVVADTSPINYLILIGHIEILRLLYGEVLIPPAVHEELLSPGSPLAVSQWISTAPAWLLIRSASASYPRPQDLDRGESEAIALAEELKADYVAIDERFGRAEANQRGLQVIGTLGLLRAAHGQGLVDLHEAIRRLSGTNFRIASDILKALTD